MMNPAHLHLMLNHLPIIGTPFVLAVLAWGVLRGSREIIRLAAAGAVIVAALTYPVFLTGEPAEERVENSTWFQERLVHQHEERAEVALIAMIVTGLAAGALLWVSRGGRAVPKAASGITLAGLAVSAALFGWTALAGGHIRHDEVRPGAELAPGYRFDDDDD
jgi:hypothetical protein